jgi:hypothetical protein
MFIESAKVKQKQRDTNFAGDAPQRASVQGWMRGIVHKSSLDSRILS